MPPLPDGFTLDAPSAKASPSVADRVMEKLAQSGQSTPRSAGEKLGHQLGLTARWLGEGAGTMVTIPANALAGLLNLGFDAAEKFSGSKIPHRFADQGDLLSYVLTRAGLPQPENATERVVGDASRLLAGAGTMAGTAGALANSSAGPAAAVLDAMAANPGAQAASAVGAGTAGGATREAGGGPWAQFAASLLGGIAAPVAAGKAGQLVDSAVGAARRLLQPDEIAGQVQIAFQRAGVNWDALSEAARRSLIDDAQAAVYSGQTLDDAAMRRLADYRNAGATPLVGDITQNPGLVTRQRNLSKTQANMAVPVGPNLPAIENQNARTVLGNLDDMATSQDDAVATGEALINRVRSVDSALKSKEARLYDAARKAAGQDIPLERGDFVNRAFEALAKENKLPFLPSQVREVLNDINLGTVRVNGKDVPVPFTVSTMDNLKTMLATAARNTADGNTRRAIGIVRDALENTQAEALLGRVGGQAVATSEHAAALQAAQQMPKEAMDLLDRARAFARTRRDWQESQAFIEDALNGATPDKFVQKHIISGAFDNMRAVRKLTGSNKALVDAVRSQMIAYIKQRGGADSDVTRFSSKGMEDALRAIGDRKLSAWFTPEQVASLKSTINVAKYMQAQPIGSAVNNSNSAAMIVGRLLESIAKGSKFVPFGEAAVGAPITGATVALNARAIKDVGKVLAVPAEPAQLPASALALGAAAAPSGDDDGRH